MKTIAIDWANDTDNVRAYDGTKIKKTLPKVEPDLIIVTENIPVKQAKPYLEAGVKIFRCNTDLTAKYRDELLIEKTHDNDVQILFTLFHEQPQEFREWKYDPVYGEFATLYASFKEIQKVRVAISNRVYSNESDTVKMVLKDFEAQERKVLKTIEGKLDLMPIYTQFLEPIKGVGPATAAGLIAYTGNVTRFNTVSALMKYFGLHVVGGKAPRKTPGQQAKWHHRARALILGVMADCFVKLRTPYYRELYDLEKEKQLPLCDKRFIADKRARRKMMKQFIKDYYRAYVKIMDGGSKGL